MRMKRKFSLNSSLIDLTTSPMSTPCSSVDSVKSVFINDMAMQKKKKKTLGSSFKDSLISPSCSRSSSVELIILEEDTGCTGVSTETYLRSGRNHTTKHLSVKKPETIDLRQPRLSTRKRKIEEKCKTKLLSTKNEERKPHLKNANKNQENRPLGLVTNISQELMNAQDYNDITFLGIKPVDSSSKRTRHSKVNTCNDDIQIVDIISPNAMFSISNQVLELDKSVCRKSPRLFKPMSLFNKRPNLTIDLTHSNTNQRTVSIGSSPYNCNPDTSMHNVTISDDIEILSVKSEDSCTPILITKTNHCNTKSSSKIKLPKKNRTPKKTKGFKSKENVKKKGSTTKNLNVKLKKKQRKKIAATSPKKTPGKKKQEKYENTLNCTLFSPLPDSVVDYYNKITSPIKKNLNERLARKVKCVSIKNKSKTGPKIKNRRKSISTKKKSNASKLNILSKVKNNVLFNKCSKVESHGINENVYNPNPIEVDREGLRPISIDGSNVGYISGTVSLKRIQSCVQFFADRGCTKIKVFLPLFRKNMIPEAKLKELEQKCQVVFTASGQRNGANWASYDDRYIVQYAHLDGAIIVSNDKYRDIIQENPVLQNTIRERSLTFRWIGDSIVFSEYPLGLQGPKMEEFLRFPH